VRGRIILRSSLCSNMLIFPVGDAILNYSQILGSSFVFLVTLLSMAKTDSYSNEMNKYEIVFQMETTFLLFLPMESRNSLTRSRRSYKNSIEVPIRVPPPPSIEWIKVDVYSTEHSVRPKHRIPPSSCAVELQLLLVP
jgi:hypothetical protein